jgi:integrase
VKGCVGRLTRGSPLQLLHRPGCSSKGAPPRALPDRWRAGAARIGHPRSRDQGHSLGRGRAKAECQAPVAKRAGLNGVRLHDLRQTYASFGAGGGLGLPIIGKLLGHTQASTTQRYAHLDADPLRGASEAIASCFAAALDGKRGEPVVQLKRGHRR